MHYSDDVHMASWMGMLAEHLINGNPDEHSLRARLTLQHCTVRTFFEPFQSAVDTCQNGYNSARIAGDVDNAMLSLWVYCIVHIFSIPDLLGLHKKMTNFSYQMVSWS